MGEYYANCGITRVPILEGDAVVALLVNRTNVKWFNRFPYPAIPGLPPYDREFSVLIDFTRGHYNWAGGLLEGPERPPRADSDDNAELDYVFIREGAWCEAVKAAREWAKGEPVESELLWKMNDSFDRDVRMSERLGKRFGVDFFDSISMSDARVFPIWLRELGNVVEYCQALGIDLLSRAYGGTTHGAKLQHLTDMTAAETRKMAEIVRDRGY